MSNWMIFYFHDFYWFRFWKNSFPHIKWYSLFSGIVIFEMHFFLDISMRFLVTLWLTRATHTLSMLLVILHIDKREKYCSAEQMYWWLRLRGLLLEYLISKHVFRCVAATVCGFLFHGSSSMWISLSHSIYSLCVLWFSVWMRLKRETFS